MPVELKVSRSGIESAANMLNGIAEKMPHRKERGSLFTTYSGNVCFRDGNRWSFQEEKPSVPPSNSEPNADSRYLDLPDRCRILIFDKKRERVLYGGDLLFHDKWVTDPQGNVKNYRYATGVGVSEGDLARMFAEGCPAEVRMPDVKPVSAPAGETARTDNTVFGGIHVRKSVFEV